jgi:hypothetical protein
MRILAAGETGAISKGTMLLRIHWGSIANVGPFAAQRLSDLGRETLTAHRSILANRASAPVSRETRTGLAAGLPPGPEPQAEFGGASVRFKAEPGKRMIGSGGLSCRRHGTFDASVNVGVLKVKRHAKDTTIKATNHNQPSGSKTDRRHILPD